MTCHGKLKDGETFLGGLSRELSEELGEVFSSVIYHTKDLEDYVKIVVVDNPEKEIITFGLTIEAGLLDSVRFGPSTGGFDFVTRDGVGKIQDLNLFDKKTGVTDLNVIAMFPDEIEAIKKAFEVLGK